MGRRMFKSKLRVSRLLYLDHERHSPLGAAKREGLTVYLSEIASMYLQSRADRTAWWPALKCICQQEAALRHLQFRVMWRSTRAGDCQRRPLLDRSKEILSRRPVPRGNRRSSWRRRPPRRTVGIALCVSTRSRKQQQKDEAAEIAHNRTFLTCRNVLSTKCFWLFSQPLSTKPSWQAERFG